MTTTVRVMVSGNKACEVAVKGSLSDTPTVIKPGQFVDKLVHGELELTVKEVGEFLS